MNDPFILHLSGVYPSRNVTDRMHFRKRNRLKNEYQRSVGAEIKVARAKYLPAFPGRVEVWVGVFFKSRSGVRRDRDNYAPKWLMDALVRGGVIKDDNSKVVDGPHVELYSGAADDCVIVSLIDLEGQIGFVPEAVGTED